MNLIFRLACVSCLLLALFISSCSTDFETITPYKETMVIYGLLNPPDKIQYIRISKAYLGEGNALEMAKQPDSIYYGNILDVKLERYLNGSLRNTYSLTRLDTVPKDVDGTFAAPYQVVYALQFPANDSIRTDGSTYKLTVKNTQSGLIATASTGIIPDVKIVNPGTNAIDFTRVPEHIYFSVTPTSLGKIYSMRMQVNYLDSNKSSGTVVPRHFDWSLGDMLSSGNLFEDVKFWFYKSELFTRAQDNAPPADNNKVYAFTNISLYVSGGTEDIFTYMQVTQPATGTVQYRPLYTNVQNGVGLFSCRYSKLKPVNMSTSTIDSLNHIFN